MATSKAWRTLPTSTTLLWLCKHKGPPPLPGVRIHPLGYRQAEASPAP